MSVDHERYASWDAAYALGALSTSERAEFEEHLAECPRCRAAVAELGSTVSLLSQVSTEDALRIGAQDADAGAVRVLADARARRSARRRIGAWAAGIAAAVVVAAVVSVSLLMPRPAEAVALEPVAGAPVTATVSLTDVPWGTRLDLVCAYDGYGTGATGRYELVVTAEDGAQTTLSTWSVDPGATARLSAGTSLSADDIRSIEIRDDSGTVMVRHEFD
jgi:hypothetical protein